MFIDTVNERTENARLYGFMILIGAGAGCYVVAGFPIAQARVPMKEVSDAVGAIAIGTQALRRLFSQMC